MKNVFVEGIQGLGKSTLVNQISKLVPELRICREGDYSPVDLAWCTWMTHEEYQEVLKKYEPLRNEIMKNTVREQDHYVTSYTRILTDIPHFHKDLEQHEINNGRKPLQDFQKIIFSRYNNFKETGYVFECAFFQNIIESLILFYLLSDDEIVEFYGQLYRNVHQENFQLLYLYSEEIEKSIQEIKAQRSDYMGNELWYQLMLEYLKQSPYGKLHGYSGFQDMVAHFHHRQQLELRIIKEVIGDRAAILPAKQYSIEEDVYKRIIV